MNCIDDTTEGEASLPFAVVAGQVYVGTGYRSMSKSLDAWFDKTINIMIQKRLMREMPPRRQEYYQDEMPIIR